MNYINRHTEQIVSKECFQLLPLHRRNDYDQTELAQTHRIVDDGDIYTVSLNGEEERIKEEEFIKSFATPPKIKKT